MKTNRPNIYSHESQQTGLNPHHFLLAVATLEYAQTQPAIHTITLPQDPHPEHRTHPLSLLLLNQNKQQSGRTP